MKSEKWAHVAWMVVALSFCLAGMPVAQETRGPKLVVNELTYDFGDVKAGTPVSHVFELSNAGDETLVIERVQPT